MSNTEYTPYTMTKWHDGDQITTDKMTNIENGIAALSAQVGEALGSTYGSLNERMDDGLINISEGIATLKGDLYIKKEHPGVYFFEEESARALGGLYQVNDSQENNRIALYQRVPGSEIEAFFLPVPSEHTAQTNYSILTSKNPVTIACGGTGATTAEDARVNLGLGTVLTDISTLQNRVNGIVFSELLTVSNNKTLTIQRVDTSKLSTYMVLVGSADDNGKTILLGHFTAGGTPTLVSLRTASGITRSTATTGQATIKNTLDASLYIKILVFYGTTLTFSIA